MSIASFALSVVLGSASAGQTSFVNWETAQCHPVEMTPDGTRLLVLSTPQNRLLVYSLTTDPPTVIGAVPVGLDPTSVRARNNDEAWVVNNISDSVSIVDLTTMNVRQTITVGDEPYDVVFAGAPSRAFVSVAAANQLWVYDAANPTTPTTVNIQGEDPRALATDGTKVFAAIFESGNRTSIIKTATVSSAANPYAGDPNPPPNSGTAFNPPIAPGLPAPPAVSLIVKRMPDNSWRDDNNGNWSGALLGFPHDNDVVCIDANTLTAAPAKGLMNINMAIGLRPLTGGGSEVTVVGTDATNHVRFEPNNKSTFVRVMLGTFNAATPTSVSVADLNPHLNYSVRSVAQNIRDQAVGDPRGIAWNADGSVGYVTGMGSNNVVAIAPGGARLARLDVGEGPTGIVFDTARQRLYVLNRFENSLSVLGVAPSMTELNRLAIMDPTPAAIKVGRKFLFDTHLTSGLGQASCAACHVDGKMDQLAWDLGDPQGAVKIFNQTCLGSNCGNWHPMKGPLTTQTLQGSIGTEPLHWRGDREGLSAFAGAFISINGDDAALSSPDMAAFQAYLATLAFPPTPNRTITHALPTTFSNGGNPLNGQNLFNTAPVTGATNLPCIACHTTSSGADFGIIPGADFNGTQSMKIPHFRNMFKKTGFSVLGSNNNRGFGYIHDGTFESVTTFLTSSVFIFPSGSTGVQQRRDLEAFLFCWDTGVHSAVGRQSTLVDFATASPSQVALLDTFETLADSNAVGLIVKGIQGGIARGWKYVGAGNWQADTVTETAATSDLRTLAAPGTEFTFTVVPKGMETRLGIDRDDDGFYDRTEVLVGTDPDNALSVPPPCMGDLNGDRIVNTADLSLFLGVFGQTVTPGAPGDFNGSGTINTADLALLLGGFGTSCPLP